MLVLKSNCIFDSVDDKSFRGYVVIENERIIEVGRGEIDSKKYENALFYDLKNKTIMPGFCDNHVHMYPGALEMLSINIRETKSEEEVAEKLFDYYKEREDEWILGFGWLEYKWENPKLPSKNSLDKFFPKKPVVLFNDEMHSIWVNSYALKICNITKRTKEKGHGKIVKDEKGEPTGLLLEPDAIMLVTEKMFSSLGASKAKKAIRTFIERAHALGITSVADNELINTCRHKIYKEIEEEGDLDLRIFFSPWITEPIKKVLKLKKKYCSDKLTLLGVKGFIDGTPLAHTGYLLEDYNDMPGYRGEMFMDSDWLKKKAIEFNRHNIPLRLHACGDRAVREALNAFEAAKNENIGTSVRNTIEHIEVINKKDLKRFKQTGTIASIQPRHMVMSSLKEHEAFGILGEERAKLAWPGKTLADNGAIVSFGTDYPIVDLDPINTIYRAVTRVMGDDLPKEGWNPKEEFSVAEAIKNATINVAYMMNMEKKIGTLERGKLADIVVLSDDIFSLEPMNISKVSIEKTIFNGEIVFEKENCKGGD